MMPPTVIDKPEPKRPEPSQEDLAAHAWQTHLPYFRDKIEELSNRQLKRVVTALIEHPLEKVPFHFPYSQEKELFDLGSILLDAKFVMMRSVFEMKKDEIDALLKEGLVSTEEKKDDAI